MIFLKLAFKGLRFFKAFTGTPVPVFNLSLYKGVDSTFGKKVLLRQLWMLGT
jgi:hypothetical protein